MKNTLSVVCFLFLILFGTAALAQTAGPVLSGEISSGISFTSHTMRASQPVLPQEQNLLGYSSNPSAHGDRPLWEFAQPRQEVPLGDVAREYRKLRADNKKTLIVHQN